MNIITTWNQLNTGKCPVSLPYKERMLWQVMTSGILRSLPLSKIIMLPTDLGTLAHHSPATQCSCMLV